VSAPANRRLPALVAGVSVLMMTLGISLSLVYVARTGDTRPIVSHVAITQVGTLLYAGLGALITARHPHNAVGWLILVTGFCSGLTALAAGTALYGLVSPANARLATLWAQWLDRWVWLPTSALPTLFIFLLFPDGCLPGRRWAPVGWAGAMGLAAAILGLALHPGTIEAWDIRGENPVGIPGAGQFLEAVHNLGLLAITLAFIGSVLAVGVRFRRSRGVEREQMKWLLYAVGLTVFGAVLAGLVPMVVPLSETAVSELGLVVTSLGLLGIAASVSLAILRHGLYDINLVINRTLVYGALTTGVFGLYLLTIAGLGLLFQAPGSPGLALVGVGFVAVLVQPLRDRLQRGVNRLMYGERDEPYAVLSRLGQRLEGALAPETVLPNVVGTLAQALKLPYVAIALLDNGGNAVKEPEAPIAAHGAPAGAIVRLPLVYQGEALGHLEVSPRAGESLSAADRRLLVDLARQAGVAIHAVRLTADLQRSRAQLVTAREEERRRLRRDLHDGLGSQLAALHLRADTVRALVAKDPREAEAVAAELRDELRGAVSDIRRLVYELRPPALDELGLAGALRHLASKTTSTGGPRVQVEAPEALPVLPAAVEVAAYRVAQEALANVVHHAHAQTSTIRLGVDQAVHLEIADDGRGLPPNFRAGIGLRSMRERAAELGGTCDIVARPGGGTRLLARLPLLAAGE
jgi:signal transduction histidine kinase